MLLELQEPQGLPVQVGQQAQPAYLALTELRVRLELQVPPEQSVLLVQRAPLALTEQVGLPEPLGQSV